MVSEEKFEKILKKSLPYIRYTAYRLSWKLPPHITTDDLISAGMIGLMDALKRQEPSKTAFKTYAELRIKGAMIDEMRANSNISRSLRKKINQVNQAREKIEKELGRKPDGIEVAASINMPMDTYDKILQCAISSTPIRIEDFRPTKYYESDLDLSECIADPCAINALATLEKESTKKQLRKLIDNDLAGKARQILSLYYYEELNMMEIGKKLKITESRVSQIHAETLIKLKETMKRKEGGMGIGAAAGSINVVEIKEFLCAHNSEKEEMVNSILCRERFIKDNFIRDRSCFGEKCQCPFIVCEICQEQEIGRPRNGVNSGYYFIDINDARQTEEKLLCKFHKEREADANPADEILLNKLQIKKTSAAPIGAENKKNHKETKMKEAVLIHKAGLVFQSLEKLAKGKEKIITETEARKAADMHNIKLGSVWAYISDFKKLGLVERVDKGVNKITGIPYTIKESNRKNNTGSNKIDAVSANKLALRPKINHLPAQDMPENALIFFDLNITVNGNGTEKDAINAYKKEIKDAAINFAAELLKKSANSLRQKADIHEEAAKEIISEKK